MYPMPPNSHNQDDTVAQINVAQFTRAITPAAADGYRVTLGQIRRAYGVDEYGELIDEEHRFDRGSE